jgi:hypothetical protein
MHTHTHTHTHTINVNKTRALQQTTGKTGTKHRLCEIDVNITNGVICNIILLSPLRMIFLANWYITKSVWITVMDKKKKVNKGIVINKDEI